MARTRRINLSSLLEDNAAAFLVLDQERRIRQVGAGVTRRFGWTSDELEGLICERKSPANAGPVELFTSAVAPLPTGDRALVQSIEVVVPHQNGNAVSADLTCVPIPDAEGSIAGHLLLFSEAASKPRSQPLGGSGTLARTFYAELNALRLDMRKRFRSIEVLGQSPQIRKAIQQAELAARSRCGFLVHGPEGSGRRFLAGMIHRKGEFGESPFYCVDCRLLTNEQLIGLMSQLQGLSANDKAPPVAAAGTLILADAHFLPPEVQQFVVEKLLSPGGPIWVGATAAGPLSRGPFSQQIHPAIIGHLTTIEIELPSLHQRGDDVMLLAQKFLEDVRRDHSGPAEVFSDGTHEEFLRYRWPGNVRELRAVVEGAARQCRSKTIEPTDLPLGFRVGRDAQRYPVLPDRSSVAIDDILRSFERDVITHTLEHCQGNKAEAARRLGLTRPKLYRRMAALGMDPEE